MADHVLGRFRPDERDTISAAVLRAADASELFIAEGIERVMNVFNAAERSKTGSRTERRTGSRPVRRTASLPLRWPTEVEGADKAERFACLCLPLPVHKET